jgi:hypothetical protein
MSDSRVRSRRGNGRGRSLVALVLVGLLAGLPVTSTPARADEHSRELTLAATFLGTGALQAAGLVPLFVKTPDDRKEVLFLAGLLVGWAPGTVLIGSTHLVVALDRGRTPGLRREMGITLTSLGVAMLAGGIVMLNLGQVPRPGTGGTAGAPGATEASKELTKTGVFGAFLALSGLMTIPFGGILWASGDGQRRVRLTVGPGPGTFGLAVGGRY